MDAKQTARGKILAITAQVQLARALAVVVEHRIADRIDQAPVTAERLAEELKLHPRSLYRLLRMLAAEGIFAEDEAGNFAATPLSSVLCRDAEDSIAPLLRLHWQDIVWQTYLTMPHTIATGEPAFDKAHGASFFHYLAQNPEAGRLFDAAMAMISGPEDQAVAEAFDFGRFQTVVDVGGGRGGLLNSILRRFPALKGVLFDQPQVIAEANALSPGVRDRCSLVAGDFFSALPAANLYVLKRIIHDWDDEPAVKLLRNCASTMSGNGRILIVEAVIKPGNEPDPVKAQDVGMMLLTRGWERTAAEYRRLLGMADLELLHVHPVAPPSGMAVLEAGRRQ